MKKITLVTCAVLALSACAKRPDSIAPVSMGDAFSNISCSKSQAMLIEEKSTLAALSAEQIQTANGDALGVFLLGLPLGSVTGGDKEGSIGASKGKVLALENRLLSC